MAEVKWIKIVTDIFDNKKIRIIESMPEGDTIIVVWFKILMLAGNVNDGGAVYFTKDIPYTEQMLATLFDRPLTTVQLALSTFEKFGMIEVINDIIQVSNWERYQNVEGLERVRELTRARVNKYREAKRIECNVTRNVTVTQSNGTDIDIDKDKENKSILSDKQKKQLADNMTPITLDVVTYLNEKANTNFKPCTDKTKRCIKARVNEGFTLEDFKKVIDKKVNEWMGTEFQQYLRPETLFGTKFEGYLNAKEVKPKGNKFNQMIKSNYDFEAIEKEILK